MLSTPTIWQFTEGARVHPTPVNPSPGSGVVGFGGCWEAQIVPVQRSDAVWPPKLPAPTQYVVEAQLTESRSALYPENDWSDHDVPFQSAARVCSPVPSTV